MSEEHLLPSQKQARIHRERAVRLAEEGKVSEAIRELAEALRQDTREAGSWQLLGEIYGAAGYHEPAASYIQKCLQEDYANLPAWVALTNIYAQIGGPYLELAMEQVEAAFSFDPDNADLHYLKGSIQAQQGNVNMAKESFQKALTLKPGHPYAKHDLDALTT